MKYINKLTLNITREAVPMMYKSTIKASKDSVDFFRKIWDKDLLLRERFYVLFLDRSHKPIGYDLLSVGGVSSTVVDTKLIFSTALKALASSIIVAHNHPSGQLKPSKADQRLTTKIVEAGKCLEIQVLDHLILTYDSYYSFADNELI